MVHNVVICPDDVPDRFRYLPPEPGRSIEEARPGLDYWRWRVQSGLHLYDTISMSPGATHAAIEGALARIE